MLGCRVPGSAAERGRVLNSSITASATAISARFCPSFSKRRAGDRRHRLRRRSAKPELRRPEDEGQIVRRAHGPSGSNRDYVLRLAAELARFGADACVPDRPRPRSVAGRYRGRFECVPRSRLTGVKSAWFLRFAHRVTYRVPILWLTRCLVVANPSTSSFGRWRVRAASTACSAPCRSPVSASVRSSAPASSC